MEGAWAGHAAARAFKWAVAELVGGEPPPMMPLNLLALHRRAIVTWQQGGRVPPMPIDAVVKEEGSVPPMPIDAVVKEEGSVPPMPIDAVVKEEGSVPPMPIDAVVKEEGSSVPPMPIDAVVKEEGILRPDSARYHTRIKRKLSPQRIVSVSRPRA
jgi:hypothetical protein